MSQVITIATEDRIKEIQDRLMRKAVFARTIYDKTEDVTVEPGYYDVVETDHGGMHDELQFQIRVEKPINKKDLAVILMDDRNHFNSWGYLQLRKSSLPKMYTVK